jgi:hypothetical protein
VGVVACLLTELVLVQGVALGTTIVGPSSCACTGSFGAGIGIVICNGTVVFLLRDRSASVVLGVSV